MNIDASKWYYDTTALIISQQFYLEKWTMEHPNISLSSKEKLKVLEGMTETIPESLRCRPTPTCDINAK